MRPGQPPRGFHNPVPSYWGGSGSRGRIWVHQAQGSGGRCPEGMWHPGQRVALGFPLGKRVWQLLEGMAHGVSGDAGWDRTGGAPAGGWLTWRGP